MPLHPPPFTPLRLAPPCPWLAARPPPAVLQLVASPVLLSAGILAAALSSALYVVGLSYYCYITFLGYSALPFLERTEVRALLGVVMGSCFRREGCVQVGLEAGHIGGMDPGV